MRGMQPNTKKVVEYARKHPPQPGESAKQYCLRLGQKFGKTSEGIRWILKEYGVPSVGKPLPARESIKQERREKHAREEMQTLRRKNRELLSLLEEEERLREAVVEAGSRIEVHRIAPKVVSGRSEATAVIVMSDWHAEERVRPEWVNGLNDYTVAIAKQRAEAVFKNALRMIEVFGKDIPINNVVLALLGDKLKLSPKSPNSVKLPMPIRVMDNTELTRESGNV